MLSIVEPGHGIRDSVSGRDEHSYRMREISYTTDENMSIVQEEVKENSLEMHVCQPRKHVVLVKLKYHSPSDVVHSK